MKPVNDVIIIGGGPAACSAALTLRARGKSVIAVSSGVEASGLFKAERVDNFPGIPAVTGSELLEKMRLHAESVGTQFVQGRVISAMPSGKDFFVSVGADVLSAGALILATGISQKGTYPGEAELLGRGVSYCATCDGMLYRGKSVAVLGFSADSRHEADFLESIGCKVEFFDRARAKKYEIRGSERIESLSADGTEYDVEGVFILRDSVAVSALLPGIALDGSSIKTARDMSTSIPGVFAAGDCTGKPYQIAKAAGEGNIAALSAVEYLNTKEK